MPINSKNESSQKHLDGPKNSEKKAARTWRTQKWEITRQRIIDATLDCIVKRGYHNTTLADIAKFAGVTRGSVQYYFPTGPDAFRATIQYLHAEWLSRYAAEIAKLNDSRNVIEDGVGLLWRLLQDPLNIAWQELRAASRTDGVLAEIIDAAFAGIERTRATSDLHSYQQLSRTDPVSFELASDFTNVFMEGLTLYPFFDRAEDRKAALMKLLIQFLRGFWLEVGTDAQILGFDEEKSPVRAGILQRDAKQALELIHSLEPVLRRLTEQ